MMVVVESRPIAEVTREIQVNEGTLGTWVSRYRQEHAGEEPCLYISERARLRELERENRCRVDLEIQWDLVQGSRNNSILYKGVPCEAIFPSGHAGGRCHLHSKPRGRPGLRDRARRSVPLQHRTRRLQQRQRLRQRQQHRRTRQPRRHQPRRRNRTRCRTRGHATCADLHSDHSGKRCSGPTADSDWSTIKRNHHSQLRSPRPDHAFSSGWANDWYSLLKRHHRPIPLRRLELSKYWNCNHKL
ncbi:hypothetical protein KJK32_45280 [Streptomyces sp. JCM17656]|nr:hypothetical protein KJK32_45280 [Streptomyces sp. JCM17656]